MRTLENIAGNYSPNMSKTRADCAIMTPDAVRRLTIITVTQSMKENPRTRDLIERYPDELELLRHLPHGSPLSIPRSFLWGTQRADEYSKRKRRLAEKEYKKRGKDFLLENPIIICALPIRRGGIQLAIVDGHHRVRYAPSHMHEIPALVFSPKQLVKVMNEGRTREKRFNKETYVAKLNCDIADATGSFNSMPENKQPRYITFASSIDELKKRFKSFERTLQAGKYITFL